MRTTMHHLAEDYLARLHRAAQALPPQERDELLAEIRNHLDSALPADATDADVRNVLHELGAPEDIVAAARPEPGAPPPPPASPWGALEIIAVLALVVGTFLLPVIGPLVGIVLVWGSTRWTRREKLVATALTLLPLVAVILGALTFLAVRTDGQEEQVPVHPVPSLTSGSVS